MVTPYATNAAGEAAYHDLTTVRTLAYLRASLRSRIATKFARHKLGGDDARGANVITPAACAPEIIALFGEWEAAGLVGGRKAFIAGVQVERDSKNASQGNVSLPPDVVNGMRVLQPK